MPIAVVALMLFSFLPVRWLGWTHWFAAQVEIAIVPVTHPLTIAVDTIVPARISNPEASERERALGNEIELLRLQLLQTQRENDRLSEQIDQFGREAAMTPDLNVKQYTRPRIANLVGDLLLIRTGNANGVTKGTVAVVDAVQIVGRVSRVEKKTATVLPITAKGAQPILSKVMLDESGNRYARCLLRPVGDGTLRGEVPRTPGDPTLDVKIGQEVRLLDSLWPSNAQMLLIGKIERIERNTSQPLRPKIIVRPTFKDLRRVPEVILRVPLTEAEPAAGGTP